MKAVFKVLDLTLAAYVFGLAVWSGLHVIFWPEQMPAPHHIWLAMTFAFLAFVNKTIDRQMKDEKL